MFFILKPDEPLFKTLRHQSGSIIQHNLINDLPGLKETADSIVKIVALLPEEYRKVFYLKVVQGMSVYEISLIRKCTMLSVYLELWKVRRFIGRNVEGFRFLVRV